MGASERAREAETEEEQDHLLQKHFAQGAGRKRKRRQQAQLVLFGPNEQTCLGAHLSSWQKQQQQQQQCELLSLLLARREPTERL